MDAGPLRLSVVVPAYDEEACVERTIPDLLGELARARIRHEVIVVDNGSRDRTPELLDRLAREHRALRVLHVRPNRGYGGAIIAGFREARGEVVGFTCADGEVDAADVVTQYRLLESGALDLVKGKRIGRRDGWRRQLLSFGYHVLVGLVFKVHITDINGYPVLLRRAALERVPLTRTNWIVNVELLHLARKAGLRMCEVDVPHRARAGRGGHVRWYFPFLFAAQLVAYWRATRRASSEEPAPGKAPVAP